MGREKENLVLKSLKVFLNISLILSFFTFLLVIINSVTAVVSQRWKNPASTLMALMLVLTIAAITLIIYELRCIIQTVIVNKPFTSVNIKRFRWISAAMFIMAIFTLVNNVLQYGYDFFYIIHLDHTGISSRPGILIMLFLAVLSFVLGEVFKHALNIEEDNKLTI